MNNKEFLRKEMNIEKLSSEDTSRETVIVNDQFLLLILLNFLDDLKFQNLSKAFVVQLDLSTLHISLSNSS